MQKYGARHYDQIVHDAGFYDGAPDPDYVAGHFKNQLAYNEWMDYQIDESAPEEFWDESQGKMVVSGEQGDNTYWDEETRSYKPIEDTPAVVSAAPPTDTTVTQPDLDEGWTAETGDDVAWETEEEWQARIDAEEKAQQEQDAADAAQQEQEQAALEQEQADAAAKADAAKPQTVPDETPGATAPHEYIYHEQHHEALHLAADATAPMHIKVI